VTSSMSPPPCCDCVYMTVAKAALFPRQRPDFDRESMDVAGLMHFMNGHAAESRIAWAADGVLVESPEAGEVFATCGALVKRCHLFPFCLGVAAPGWKRPGLRCAARGGQASVYGHAYYALPAR